LIEPSQERGARSRRSVTQLIALLIVITLGLFAAMTQLIVNLYQSQNAAAWSVREDAMWAAFQADREAARLIEAMRVAQRAPTPENIDAALLRYDLLYSRALVLEQDSFAIKFDASSPVSEAAFAARAVILALDNWIEDLSAGSGAFSVHVEPFIVEVAKTQEATGQLLMILNEALNSARVDERTEVARMNLRLVICAVLIALLFVSIVALQSVQLTQIGRSRREIEALSERNAMNAERAEAGSRAKSMFLATMSHEIRTPLNGLIGTVELMFEDNLTPEQTKNLMTIQKSGEVLLDVISDILDFSKMEAGRLVTELKPCSLTEIVNEVSAIMGQRAKQAGLVLSLKAPALSVTTDGARVRQVLVNLIGNAIKFTSTGSVTVDITRVGNDRLLVEVKDTGIGISEPGLLGLFKDFSQVDGSASRAFSGTGLGLAICKRIVEGLGGTIGVQSILGVGSRFWFEIPVSEVLELPRATENDQVVGELHPTLVSPLGKLSGRVLVVEDNEINRRVVTGLLDRLGIDFQIAKDGAVAVEMVCKEDFDVVLMDYQMPVMNGLDATRAIRAKGMTVPIVGLTANAFVDDRDACLGAGMNDFIAKPVTRAKLIQTLSVFCAAGAVRAMPEDDGVDWPQFDALLEELGPEVVADLLFSFRNDADTLFAEVQVAEANRDAVALDRALHGLKGVSHTIGLAKLANQAQAMRLTPSPSGLGLSDLQLSCDLGLATLTKSLSSIHQDATEPLRSDLATALTCPPVVPRS
jgi:two-component system, sensor histidine kinase